LRVIDREIFEAVDLGALDLGVPIGALDQPHHHPAAGAAGEIDDEVEHEGAALAIGLHDEAEPFQPARAGRAQASSRSSDSSSRSASSASMLRPMS
jgi:hypothetical protein